VGGIVHIRCTNRDAGLEEERRDAFKTAAVEMATTDRRDRRDGAKRWRDTLTRSSFRANIPAGTRKNRD